MPQLLRRHERVRGRAKKQVGGRGQLAPAQKDPLIPHNLGRVQQVQRVKVEDAPRLRLVARAHVVTGEAKHVAHAQRRRPQQITLNCNPVPITATHLQDRLIACPRHQRATGHAAHVTVRPRTVGGVYAVAYVPQRQNVGVYVLRVRGIRRVQLRRHRKVAALQHLQQTRFTTE